MRLREWRDVAPRKECMRPKVLSVIDEALDLLGAEPNPDCWVAWGDDPTVRYTVFAPIDAGLLKVNVRVNVPGEGPRAPGKLVRWNRVQIGELAVEIQGGHRLLNFQIEGLVLRGTDDEADDPLRVRPDRVRRAWTAGRRSSSPASAPAASGPIVTPVRRSRRPSRSCPPRRRPAADRRGHLRPRRGPRGLGDLVGRGPARPSRPSTAGRGPRADQAAVMGANSRGWARIMRERLDLDMPDADIERAIVDGVVARYRAGRRAAHRRRRRGGPPDRRRPAGRHRVVGPPRGHRRGPRGDRADRRLRRSSSRPTRSSTASRRRTSTSRSARRLGVEPGTCLVVEDSRNGVLAGQGGRDDRRARPEPAVPPAPGAAEAADLVLDRLADLDPDAIARD